MIRQLSIFVENEVGSLARITTALKDNNINLRAISSFDSPEYGIMRLIADDPAKTKEVLNQLGFAVKITEVIAVELEDEPGALDNVLHILANAGISVNYIYSFVLRKNNAPLMILNMADMEVAESILVRHGVKVVGEEELH